MGVYTFYRKRTTMNSTSMTLSANRRVLASLTCAVLVTLFLFYVDEGYNDFRWMRRPGNWIPFAFYTGAIWGVQLLISEVLLQSFSARVKTVSTFVAGLGILAAMVAAFSR
jgi:hypothetical protein